ncbi:WXG100 family type VII secretion target [Nocardioides sp. LHG3406-4]|uniref:WXG100 family type VII secretion target n=1 Tax=Nocardioides sp. LHG3406-4 TaxID=2804575 RepID=UPI003CF608A4
MTEYSHHPDFRSDVEKKVQEFSDKIQEGVNWVIDEWEKCIGNQNWMWIVSPAVKLAYELAGDRLQDAINAIWDYWEEKSQEIWDSVDNVAGDPFELMAMNEAYHAAAGAIRDEKIVLGRIVSTASSHWEGLAFTAFSDTIEEQKNAIAGVDSGLTSAATACAEGAKQINDVWNDIVDGILDYASSIVDAIKEGTDAGQWVTLDTGPAIKVILDAAIKVAQLALVLEKYWAENATVKASMWTGLNSGLDGLDANNDWPNIASARSSDMNDKDDWDQK